MTPRERQLRELIETWPLSDAQRAAVAAIYAPKTLGRPPVKKDANGHSDTIHAQARIWNYYRDCGYSLEETLARYKETAGVTTVEAVCKIPDVMGRPRRARAEVYRCAKLLREADDTIIADEFM